MQLTELDVVNNCLATQGLSPLNELEEDNPDVAAIRRFFAMENHKMQAEGWWFNKEFTTLYADPVSQFIYVPLDTIDCHPRERPNGGGLPITIRGRRFYDPNEGVYEMEDGIAIECDLIREVPFDDLPATAKFLVDARTRIAYQQYYDADRGKLQILAGEAQEALTNLKRENIRNSRPNNLERPFMFSRLRRIGGNSIYRRTRW